MKLTEKFFADLSGWQAMKEARAILAADRVLSSYWEEPLLRGVVQAGQTSYRAGLVIKSERDIENVCPCRESRQWGKICAHSVAVGLHWLRRSEADQEEHSANVQTPLSSRPDRAPRPDERKTDDRAWLKRTVEGAYDRPLSLQVLLPPNLVPSLERGRIMVYLQAAPDHRFVPLPAVPDSSTYGVTVAEHEILRRLEEWIGGAVAGAVQLTLEQFLELLPVLRNHPRVTLGKSTLVQVSDQPWCPRVRAILLESGEIEIAPLDDRRAGRPDWMGGGWVFIDSQFKPVARSLTAATKPGGSRVLSRAEVPPFLNQEWPALAEAGAVESNFKLEDFTLIHDPPSFELHLTGGMAMLDAELQGRYGERTFRPGESEGGWFLPDPQRTTTYRVRNFGAEKEANDWMIQAGFLGPDKQGVWTMRGQDNVLDFFARHYPRMRRAWKIELAERLEASTQRNLEWVEPRVEVSSSGMQWFDVNVTYQGDSGHIIPPEEVRRLLQSGRGHTKLGSGKAILMDTEALTEFEEVLRDCSPRQQDGSYRMKRAQAGFLGASAREMGWKVRGSDEWIRTVDQASGHAKPHCPPLGELESVLREYQKEGVAWLNFLAANRFGGILADDMGLGKTLQTLAFLQHLVDSRRQAGEKAVPSLVVCPASLVENWRAEAARFTPSLKVLALHGPSRRARFDDIADADLVVTTYGLIRRDEETYRDREFLAVILDEAQHIKNRQTQNARAVKSVQGLHRFVLTGTPMENSVLDLWSIFDFIMPGYLGSARDFRERYEVPLTREGGGKTSGRLARRIRPFLLRRLKQEVAKELPERIEQVAYCEMTDDQKRLYQQVLEATRHEVMASTSSPGTSSPQRMAVLNALLRLRQICCDPRLLSLEESARKVGSGKMDMFEELLQEALDGGHRVLVFSQFVSMLSLIRASLDESAISYCYLDGSTRDRQAEVDRFQKDASIPVFLISLKAGGVGLNLTGADTVIHFDPWWNPAVEAQATDRAHRIGQSRVVTSYKLISRDTVEEKILRLQESKRDQTLATLGGENELAETLSWDEIQGLLD